MMAPIWTTWQLREEEDERPQRQRVMQSSSIDEIRRNVTAMGGSVRPISQLPGNLQKMLAIAKLNAQSDTLSIN